MKEDGCSPSAGFLAEGRPTEEEAEGAGEGFLGPVQRAWLRVILRSEVAMDPGVRETVTER